VPDSIGVLRVARGRPAARGPAAEVETADAYQRCSRRRGKENTLPPGGDADAHPGSPARLLDEPQDLLVALDHPLGGPRYPGADAHDDRVLAEKRPDDCCDGLRDGRVHAPGRAPREDWGHFAQEASGFGICMKPRRSGGRRAGGGTGEARRTGAGGGLLTATRRAAGAQRPIRLGLDALRRRSDARPAVRRAGRCARGERRAAERRQEDRPAAGSADSARSAGPIARPSKYIRGENRSNATSAPDRGRP